MKKPTRARREVMLAELKGENISKAMMSRYFTGEEELTHWLRTAKGIV